MPPKSQTIAGGIILANNSVIQTVNKKLTFWFDGLWDQADEKEQQQSFKVQKAEGGCPHLPHGPSMAKLLCEDEEGTRYLWHQTSCYLAEESMPGFSSITR